MKKLLPTSTAGSLPKPSWLAEPEKLWSPWKLHDQELIEGKKIQVSSEYLLERIELIYITGIILIQESFRKWTKKYDECNSILTDIIFESLQEKKYSFVEKLSKYIEKKNDNTNHAAELKNAPGRICFVLKFSLGKKRYIMIKTTINVKNARKKRIVAKNTCLFSRTGSKRYN